MDLGDRIEVHFRSVGQAGEQLRSFPFHPRESLREQPLVALGVAIIELHMRVGEHEAGSRRLAGINALYRHGPAGVHVRHAAMVEQQTIFDVEEPETLAQRRDVLLFGPEHEFACGGMQAIRSDDEVVAAAGSVAEGHLDPLAVVVECGNPHAETVIDVIANGLVQDAGERAPVDLDLAAEHLGGQAADFPAPAVDEYERAHAGGVRPHRVEQTHLLEHRERRPAKVDSLPAGA